MTQQAAIGGVGASPVAEIRIGAALQVSWAKGAKAPGFTLA